MFRTRRKLLSQNFLKDRGLLKSLIQASGISHTDMVLEIGAGNGIITECLLSVAKKVIAVEVDKSLAQSLSNHFGRNKSLIIVPDNFLDIKLPREQYKVFSNIPFSITGEIIKKLLFSDNPPERCSLVVQKEAAEKFLINQRKTSMLSVLFYPWFEIKTSYFFKKTDFTPTPNVNSCLLQIVKRTTPLVSVESRNKYLDFVVYKFTKVRSVNSWPMSQWLSAYKQNPNCRGYFAKWQSEQSKLVKIHRTRVDKEWRKFAVQRFK